MNTRTTTAHYFDSCCMSIDKSDSEISFQDYSTDETILIEGLTPGTIQGAIFRYVHNLAVDKESVEWLKAVASDITSTLARPGSVTNQ